ncbi:MAG: hypothetical protein IJD45_04075 [Clostridia bacterium]|nr:hypothetical protein [Clostridia bacterium]
MNRADKVRSRGENNKKYYITFVSYVDSLDWKENATPESICKRVTNKVKNGSIVLFHNDADHTPAALPNILKCLKDEGYEFVFISDLILKENYEIKHDGTQCKLKDGAN